MYGGTPRVTVSLPPQRVSLFGFPVYGSLNSDSGYLPYFSTLNGETVSDRSLGRVDVFPTTKDGAPIMGCAPCGDDRP